MRLGCQLGIPHLLLRKGVGKGAGHGAWPYMYPSSCNLSCCSCSFHAASQAAYCCYPLPPVVLGHVQLLDDRLAPACTPSAPCIFAVIGGSTPCIQRVALLVDSETQLCSGPNRACVQGGGEEPLKADRALPVQMLQMTVEVTMCMHCMSASIVRKVVLPQWPGGCFASPNLISWVQNSLRYTATEKDVRFVMSEAPPPLSQNRIRSLLMGRA